MKKNILKCCAAALVLAGGVSCTDLLDMTPTNLVSDKTMWEKTETAEWAVNSLYTYVYSVIANQSVVGLTESLTDMMKYGSYNYNSLAFVPSEFAYGEDHTIKATYGLLGDQIQPDYQNQRGLQQSEEIRKDVRYRQNPS